MRLTIVTATCALGAFAAACSTDNPGPALTITPGGGSGALAVSGPTDFAAVLVNSSADITWSLAGSGSISSATGLHTVFQPVPGTAAATLTATDAADSLTASVKINAAPATLTAETIPGLTAPVTVAYDAEDIPHITCAAALDCFAVQGYIQARDRFFPMDFLRHVARAHLSELIGLQGLSQDVQLRTLFMTRAGHRLEDDLAAVMDDNSKKVITSFAGGINAYLAQLRANPALLPGEYAQLPVALQGTDLADWTVQDTLAMARLQQFQLSETIEEESSNGVFASAFLASDPAKINAWIRAAAPTTEQAHTLQPAVTPAPVSPVVGALPGNLEQARTPLAAVAQAYQQLRALLRPQGAAVGSNNWVVGAAKSATGVAMVANDPHLSLQYPPLFHLSVMTSTTASDNLDLAGGAFPGIPGDLVGRGAHVGWGVTVVGYDVTDLYLEQFLPQGNCGQAVVPCVLFKGAPVATLPVPQTWKIRVAPGAAGLVDSTTLSLGAAAPPPVLLIVPHHGPIIQAPNATTGIGVSVRWSGQEGNTQDLKAIIGLNTAANVDAAVAALTDFSTGAQNFVLADDAGHIAYDPHALVPIRNFADARLHHTQGDLPIPPWFPLKGDGTAEWGDGTSDCASATLTPVPRTCWTADADLPHGKDPAKGFFFTANADPTSPSVSDDNNPLGHPPYLSFDWDDSSGFRAARINELLEAKTASAGKVSLQDMEAIQADHVSRPGAAFAPFIAAIPADAGHPQLALAQGVLAQWATNGFDCPSGLLGTDPETSPIDPTPAVVQNSSGCFLFHEFLRVLLTNTFADDLAVAGQGVDGLFALKSILFMLNAQGTPPQIAAQTTLCNDVNATGTQIAAHTCIEQVAKALVTAYATLSAQVDPAPAKWVWGRVHTIQPVSLLALVTTGYSPGPYARPGGAFTVDVGSPSLSGGGLDFGYRSGGNVRHISVMDPATPIIKMQLPGPERDTQALFVGPDLLGQWVKNIYFDFAYGPTATAAATVSTQTFSAQ